MLLKRALRRMLLTLVCLVVAVAIGATTLLHLPPFGRLPRGKRQARIERSPNYRDGKFHNQTPTAFGIQKGSRWSTLRRMLWPDVTDLRPSRPLPAVHTDLHTLDREADVMIWFGHSSYFIQIGGRRILVDPVFHAASPFPFLVRPFEAEYNYSPADIPAVDALVITHDHYDHLDYKTVKALRERIAHVVCPLGVGEHLERWGVDTARICELDWYDTVTVDSLRFTLLPTRHFSGRGLTNSKALWGAYMLESGGYTIYMGGDGGYDRHFKDAATRFPHIDLALMEDGQYNTAWRHIHTLPEQLLQAMQDLRAHRYFTGHNSKFRLALHPWYEPLENAQRCAETDSTLHIITPKIGEMVRLDDTLQTFEHWWRFED